MCKPSSMTEMEVIIKLGNKYSHSLKPENKPFLLSIKQTLKLFKETDVCHYTKLPFDNSQDITFERVNPTLGYIPGNVVLCKKVVNDKKGCTLDNFIHSSKLADQEMGELFLTLGKHFQKLAKAKANSALQKRIRVETLMRQTEIMQNKGS